MSALLSVDCLAPAKVNLALHITGQRDDGYHLLDSLVVFVDAGDRLTISVANGREPGDHHLTTDGPFSNGLETDERNLVIRAARLFKDCPALDIRLNKRLPVASGIGGGSSDAAATLNAIAALTGNPLPDPTDVLSLGADVPVCLDHAATRMTGIGEIITPLPALPPLFMLLVNPMVAVSTASVFKSLQSKDNSPISNANLVPFEDQNAFVAFLQSTRNDLEAPARALAPMISDCLSSLAHVDDVLFARMSGSGATCFGLFENTEAAEAAGRTITAAEPDWWVAPCRIL